MGHLSLLVVTAAIALLAGPPPDRTGLMGMMGPHPVPTGVGTMGACRVLPERGEP